MKFHIGRLGRLGFTVSILLAMAVILLFVFLQAAGTPLPDWLMMTFVYVNFAWMVLLYIGRLHDVGSSGWWTLLVMLTAGLGLVVLAAWSGKKESNKYGPVPPHTVSHLFHFWRSDKAVVVD